MYYKVVASPMPNVYLSCMVPIPSLSVSYKINEWAYSPTMSEGYGLFVFDTLENAKAFAPSMATIMECEVNTEMLLPPRLDWTLDGKWKSLFFVTAWPKGTVAVKGVKLLRKVT